MKPVPNWSAPSGIGSGSSTEASLIGSRRSCSATTPWAKNLGTNTDEYEAEAGTILPRLEDVRSEEGGLDAVYEEFVGWFDPAIAGSRGNYEDVAGEVWAVWREYKTVRGGR